MVARQSEARFHGGHHGERVKERGASGNLQVEIHKTVNQNAGATEHRGESDGSIGVCGPVVGFPVGRAPCDPLLS